MKRVSDNPPSRHPERPIHQSEGIWWIAKVRPRQEKALAFDCIKMDIEYYFPMFTKVTRRKDNNKPRKSVLPLFPGYLSFCVPSGHERMLWKTERIVNIVEVKHQKHFMKELEQIYFAQDLGIPLEPLADIENIEPGTLVEIVAGPLTGIRGSVSRTTGKKKIILSVDGLGRAATTVDSSMIKIIKD
jgi:transcriptional antiterminator RfaH